MCAVVGLYTNDYNEQVHEDLQRVLHESRVRGLHAFGLGWIAPDGSTQVARKSTLSTLCQHVNNLSLTGCVRLVCHTRYSTSGDYKVEANNQPIVVGDMCLAFNGVLHMGTKADMERALGEKMDTDNDGEMFVRQVLTGCDPVHSVQHGTFTGVWLRNGRLHALTNGKRPAWLYSNGGTQIIVSTYDIAKRAGLNTGLLAPLVPNKLYQF
jgi:glutamine phosphoribosylpyrophosphate amidotransferase